MAVLHKINLSKKYLREHYAIFTQNVFIPKLVYLKKHANNGLNTAQLDLRCSSPTTNID